MGQNNLIIDLDPKGTPLQVRKSNNDEEKIFIILLIKKMNLKKQFKKQKLKI